MLKCAMPTGSTWLYTKNG